MPQAVIGVGLDGVVAYANPAAALTLGYGDSGLVGCPLQSLLSGRSLTTAEGCLALLRCAGTDVVEWCHADGFTVFTTVSVPMLLRASDHFLMITMSDVTELVWGSGPSSAPRRNG